MLITKVQIENFKRFDQLEIDLRQFDCLVGGNNSGKTTLLQAMALFDFCLHHCLSKRNGVTELKARTVSPDELYVLPVSDPVDLWTNRSWRVANKPRDLRVSFTLADGERVTAAVDFNFNRFGISVESTKTDSEYLEKLRRMRIAYLPVFSMFLPQEERRTPAIIADELSRGRVSGVIRNLLLDLKIQNRHSSLEAMLRRSFPELEELKIEFDEASDRYISVTYLEEGRPKELDVFSAGSGFQQFVYLFGFILLRQPTVVLLDEPDVHLHGSLQRALLAELQQLVVEGKQVIFATHSRELISRVLPEDIIALDDVNKARRLSIAYDVYDTLDRLGAMDPTQLPVVQAFRRVLVVENQADRHLLSVFCAKCLGETAWRQVDRRLATCYAHGSPWTSDMDKLRKQLQQMIAVEGAALQLFVVSDRDYYPDLEALSRSLPSTNIAWHIWSRAEIENYLLSVKAIGRAIHGSSTLPLDELILERKLDELLEASRDVAQDRLAKAFQEHGKRTGQAWDVSTVSRKAREFLNAHWEAEKHGLADAKDSVLPALKRWLKGEAGAQFSNKAVAEALHPQDLPDEVHALARRLAQFAGVPVP